MTVIIGLRVESGETESIIEALFDLPEITGVHSVIGRLDFICFARFCDNDDPLNFLRKELPKLEGVTVVETFISTKSLMRPVSGEWPKGWKPGP